MLPGAADVHCAAVGEVISGSRAGEVQHPRAKAGRGKGSEGLELLPQLQCVSSIVGGF